MTTLEISVPSPSPLYRDGLVLVSNAGFTSLMGVAYWALVAHLVSPSVVGVNAALVAAMIAVANVGQLSLSSALVTYLPRTGRERGRLVLVCYSIAAAVTLPVAVVFVAVAPSYIKDLTPLRTPWVATTFVSAAVVWAVFGLQDNALTGLRRAMWIPLENLAYSAGKLALLVMVGGSLAGVGVFVSWVVPAAIALVPVNILIFRRLGEDPAVASVRPHLPLHRFVTAEALAMLMAQLSTTAFPVMVVARAGAAAAGRFAIPWLLAGSVDLVAANLGMSLTTHGTGRVLRGVLRRTIPMIAAIAAAGILAAPLVVRIYGDSYGSTSSVVLRILLFASVPRAVVVLTICAARADLAVPRILALQAALAATVPTTAWLLMPRMGVEGAALGWLGGHVLAAAVAVRVGGGAP